VPLGPVFADYARRFVERCRQAGAAIGARSLAKLRPMQRLVRHDPFQIAGNIAKFLVYL